MIIDKCPLSEEEKLKMIAEAAFLKSRQRDFEGDPVADWLSAEAELHDALAAKCRLEQEEQAFSAYHRIRMEVQRLLEKAEETINAETVRQALAKATADLRKAGDILPESIDRASKAVKQEIEEAIGRLGQIWDGSRIRPNELLSDWKEKGARSWHRTTQSFQQWLTRWRNRNGN
ncbi:MAG: DUF2934 domain-containing protein [Desulfobacteraceae bacterium]|nr:DUF2934 domain-containing protein [Desulfobacteraceae bacterium]